jgi:hypothetical protein
MAQYMYFSIRHAIENRKVMSLCKLDEKHFVLGKWQTHSSSLLPIIAAFLFTNTTKIIQVEM